MVEVSYHCPYCGAVTSLEREGYLADRCVTREPLEGWEYADTTEAFEDADGVELVCLGNVSLPDAGDDPATARETAAPGERRGEGGADDPDPGADGCGRTFYLSFVRHEAGHEVDPDVPLEDYPDRPRFDFRH
jgi:hypothetical protein